MPHIEINAAAVKQEAAISGRLFVIAVMEIDRARLRFAEEKVFHPRWPRLASAARATSTDQAAVFRFDPDNPIHLSNDPSADPRHKDNAYRFFILFAFFRSLSFTDKLLTIISR